MYCEPTWPKVGRQRTLRVVSQGVIPTITEEGCQIVVVSNSCGHFAPTATYSVGMFSRSFQAIEGGLKVVRDGVAQLARLVPKGNMHSMLTAALSSVVDMKNSFSSSNVLTGEVVEEYTHYTDATIQDQPKKRRKYATTESKEDLDAFRPREFQCLCGKQLDNETQLTNHQKDKHVHVYQCELCGKEFKKGRSAWNHYLREMGLFRYKCDVEGCEWQGTNEYGSYMGHLVNQHDEAEPENWPYKCPNRSKGCKVFIQQKRFFKPHVDICNERHDDKKNCPGCKKQFTTRPSLLKHFACYHDGDEYQEMRYMYKCPHKNCKAYGKYFTHQPGLREHVVVQHGNGYWDRKGEDIKPLFVVDTDEIERRIKECYEYYSLPENAEKKPRARKRKSAAAGKDGGSGQKKAKGGDDPAGGGEPGNVEPGGDDD